MTKRPRKPSLTLVKSDIEAERIGNINIDIIQPLLERYRAEMLALGYRVIIETDRKDWAFEFIHVKVFPGKKV